MRFIVSVFATVAMIFAATAASASVDFNLVGTILTGANAGSNDTTLAAAGDQVQVDIFLTNTDAGIDTIVGASFAASVGGGGLGGLTFIGGATAGEYFSDGFSKFGANTNGVTNGDGTDNGADPFYTSIAIPHTLTGADITLSGNVRFFSAFLVTGNGDGNFDFGILDGGGALGLTTANVGNTGGEGAAHARLVFLAGAGVDTLSVGTSVDDSLTLNTAGVGTINGASIDIGFVPEPGTALLMGLGLSGLSMAGRRRNA